MQYDNPKFVIDSKQLVSGALRWRSPSNIALVKYWGKYGDQLPKNPSVSFTLDAAATDTTMYYRARSKSEDGAEIELRLDGERRPDFEERTAQYFQRLYPIYPFLRQLSFRIETSNSFPHSAGIASSASGMSALALCLVSLEEKLFEPLSSRAAFFHKASFLARLGSGSACRSVYGNAAVWGRLTDLPDSSEEFAVSVSDQLHDEFKGFHDDILLISRSEKSVSSRAGHGLMDTNPYADVRYGQAKRRCSEMLRVLEVGDLERFGEVLESEALTLHALMMASSPPYLLVEPNTINAIRAVQQWRQDTGHPLYFTLDAGPNLHLLYPASIVEPVRQFVREELLHFCAGRQYIADQMGAGPQQLEVTNTD
ncbi:MAG: diphosphomevalonate decarboxylase [Bacteroidota bacterium]